MSAVVGSRYEPELRSLSSSSTASPSASPATEPCGELRPEPHGVGSASSVRLAVAGAADHYAIFDFLVSVFRAPSSSEFQAQLEEPWYEPNDRLLIKHVSGIVGHLRLTHRDIHFGPLALPAVGVSELATAPAYRRRGLATALIVAAERRMREGTANIAFARTTAPDLFARQGWFVWGRHSYSEARTRDILAQWCVTADSRAAAERHPESKRPTLSTRIWRHVERGALMRLYAANNANAYGSIIRSDDYWRWLVSRRGYDSIYVAIEGRDKLDLDETPIIGYAVTKPGRIVEMMTDPHRPYAIDQLLRRVCGDAMERDIDSIRLDAPPTDPLHKVFANAGGEFRHRTHDSGQVMMAKLLNPLHFLQQLLPVLRERIQQGGLGLPIEFGVSIGDQRLRITVDKRGAQMESGRLGRSYLTCSNEQFAQLLLGQIDLRAAVQRKTIIASTRGATEIGALLFPRLPFWRPPWDELPA